MPEKRIMSRVDDNSVAPWPSSNNNVASTRHFHNGVCERTCGPNATFRKYVVLRHTIGQLGVRGMRHIFNRMRTFDKVDEDTFMPHYGFTTGEFAAFKTLSEQNRRETSAGGGGGGTHSAVK